MDSSVKARPFGAITAAPALTARAASGMSAVTTMLVGEARSAIQSSAASGPAGTTTRAMKSAFGTATPEFDTTATVTATQETTVLRIEKDLFFRLIADFPQIAIEIMRVLAQRLDRTTADLRELSAKLKT